MLKLLKYLKPYILLVLLAIGLLFILVNADLALPDYLSQIVNVGIGNRHAAKSISTIDSSLEHLRSAENDRAVATIPHIPPCVVVICFVS